MHAKKMILAYPYWYIKKIPLYGLCFLPTSDIVHIRVYVLFIVLVEGYSTEKKNIKKDNPVLWCITSLISS